jgi:O-antigen/teichoic acid export membrane protein
MSNSLSNYGGVLISGVAGLVLVPLMLHHLGVERYGFWVGTLTVASFVGSIDFGLGWAVTRALSAADEREEDRYRFVSAAGATYVALGIAAGLLIALGGIAFRSRLHLAPEISHAAPLVFALVGTACVGDRLQGYAAGIFYGLQRFRRLNAIVAIGVLVRAAGFAVLLLSGRGIVAVAIWNAVASVSSGLVTLALARRTDRRLRVRLADISRADLRRNLRFGVASQLIILFDAIVWRGPLLMLGFARGPAEVARFSIAQRFPLTMLGIAGSVGDVTFPAASERRSVERLHALRETLLGGTRWATLLALPAAVSLFVLAPNLLSAWLGSAPPHTEALFRLTSVAVLAISISETSSHFVWGLGENLVAVWIGGALAIAATAGSIGLLALVGITGPAVALLVCVVPAALAYMTAAARRCSLRVRDVAAPLVSLVPSAGMCAAAALGSSRIAGRSPGAVIFEFAAAGGAYVATLAAYGAHEEERMFLREAVAVAARIRPRAGEAK